MVLGYEVSGIFHVPRPRLPNEYAGFCRFPRLGCRCDFILSFLSRAETGRVQIAFFVGREAFLIFYAGAFYCDAYRVGRIPRTDMLSFDVMV